MKTKTSQKPITTCITAWLTKYSAVGVVMLTTLLFSCDPPGNIGVPPLTPVGTFFTDTLTVRTSTVLADSVRTSNPDVFLAGRYVDPIFGTIEASSFIQMSLEFQLALGATAVYDSVVLYTPYNYSYGDTLPAQTFTVHRLREQLEQTKTYYNNSQVVYDATPLAKQTFQPRPQSGGTLRFRLPDDLGKELFALSGKPAGQTNPEFYKVLNGFALIPDKKNTAVLGFTATSQALTLRIWYHTTTDSTAVGFPISAVLGSPTQTTVRAGFNRVTADRTGTVLEGIKALEPIPASSTGGHTYVQDALGIRTKVEIPYLSSLANQGPIAINRAEFSIKPDLSKVQPGMNIPPYLALLETDATNRVFYDALGFTKLVNNDPFANGSLESPVRLYDFRFKKYTWNIALHLNTILSGANKNSSFLITPVYTQSLGQGGTKFESQFNNRVTRVVFGSKPEDIELIVFYTRARE